MDKVEVVYDISSSAQDRLTEISQTKTMRFAFLTPEFKAFHPLVKCRDYFNDVLHFKPLDKHIDIYGFQLSPSENLLDIKKTRILIQVPKTSDRYASMFVENFPFIQKLEKELFEIPRSALYSVKGKPNWFVLEGNKFWQNCTGLTSLLTYLCRCSLYLKGPDDNWIERLSDPENARSVDGSYMKKLREWGLEKQLPLFKKLDYSNILASGYPETADVDVIHNFSGFVSFIERRRGEIRAYAESAGRHMDSWTKHAIESIEKQNKSNALFKQLDALETAA